MRTTTIFALVLGTLGMVAGAGCGSNEQPAPGEQGIPIDNLAAEMAKGVCGHLFACCDAGERARTLEILSPVPMTQAECDAAMGGFLNAGVSQNKESIAAGRMTYHGDKAETCMSKLSSAAGSCPAMGYHIMDEDADCQAIFEGKVPDGGTCQDGHECAVAGSVCPGNAQQPAVCTPRAGLGQGCNDIGCKDGLSCTSDSGMFICITPRADGEMCSQLEDCASAYCDSAASLCAPKNATGEMCSSNFACLDGYCDTGVCSVLKADGEPCSDFSECQSHACDTQCLPPLVCHGA